MIPKIKLNKVAKYHKMVTKTQTQQGNENITKFKFTTIENITQKTKENQTCQD